MGQLDTGEELREGARAEKLSADTSKLIIFISSLQV
jgi:hypothetical protein